MNLFRPLSIIAICSVLAACHSPKHSEAIPPEPYYGDTSQWYVVDRGGAADIFYVISTETGDYRLPDGTVRHYADTYDSSLRQLMLGEMVGVDQLLSGDLNFYSPYYRQCTMETFTADSLIADRLPLSMRDVRHAFLHYLDHYNNGRPIILAGFSQGAMAVVELLQLMEILWTDTTCYPLVAAYVIGYKVTAADMYGFHNIVPARDSADFGVTVCYNTVRDNGCEIPLLSKGNRMAINPVNWCTDATPAKFTDPRNGDLLTATLDTATLLLHLDGYHRDDYMLPLIGVEGNYHCLEISLFRDYLRRNIQLRTSSYLAAHGKTF